MEKNNLLCAIVARAARRPIYVLSGPNIHARRSDEAIDAFMRQFPRAHFVNARGHYSKNDRYQRWRDERQRYGAAVLITAAETPGDGLRNSGVPLTQCSWGIHPIGLSDLREIEDLAAAERPVLWHPLLVRGNTFVPRFAVRGFEWVSHLRAAQLLPISKAAIFRPIFSADLFTVGH